MTTPIWGLDAAIYQAEAYWLGNGRYDLSALHLMPLEEMYEHGCRFGIAKVSMQLSKDKTGADHIRVLKNAGFDTGGYHWCDPIKNWPLQVRLFSEQLQATQPKIRAFDVEQHWADWNDHSKTLPEIKIVENFEYLLARVAAFDTKPLMYSANWFINSYVKTLFMRLGIIDAWMAHYTMARRFVVNTLGGYRLNSWSQVDELMSYIHESWRTWFNGSTPARVLAPPGFPTPKVFQIDSKTILPGAPRNLDLNVWLGTEAEYETWIGRDVVEPDPEPDPDPNPDPDPDAAKMWEEIDFLKGKYAALAADIENGKLSLAEATEILMEWLTE